MPHPDIPDYDEKIDVAIGTLLAGTDLDEDSRSVLSAFDPTKDSDKNKSILSSSKFKVEALNACAQYLGIEITNPSDGNRIYSNKPSLAKRIILEIKSLYPAICAECDQEYSVAFRPDSPPPVKCFLCLQGSHGCHDFVPQDLPLQGSVWLCKSCHDANNPIKPKKHKSKANSKTPSQQPSRGEQIDKSPVQPLSPSELESKLNAIVSKRTSSNKTDNKHQARPNIKQDDICALFKEGKCPHGVSGKTAANGRSSCDKQHPKRCTKFIRNVKHKKYGCRRGNECMFFHPQHCPTAITDKCCYSDTSTLVHPVGTKRRKPPENKSYRRNDNHSRNYDNQGSRNRDRQNSSNRDEAPINNNRSRRVSFNETPSSSEAQQQNGNFLEMRSLLSTFQLSLQKEIDNLKLTFAAQEKKLSAVISHVSHAPMGQYISHIPAGQNLQLPPHPHPPIPLQTKMHVTPPPMSWMSAPASGC